MEEFKQIRTRMLNKMIMKSCDCDIQSPEDIFNENTIPADSATEVVGNQFPVGDGRNCSAKYISNYR